MHFLAAHWPYVLLAALIYGSAGLILRHEIRNAPLVDATGRPITPEDDDARIADREDALYLRTGHRDHEQPGGVL